MITSDILLVLFEHKFLIRDKSIKTTKRFNSEDKMLFFVWKMFHQTGWYTLKILQKTMMRKNRLIVGSRKSLWLLQAHLPFADTNTLQTLVHLHRTSARGLSHPSFSLSSFSFLFYLKRFRGGRRSTSDFRVKSRLIKNLKTILFQRAEYRFITHFIKNKYFNKR